MPMYPEPYRTLADGRTRATVWTDGGCAPTNPSLGAWAFTFTLETHWGTLYGEGGGHLRETTNNRMELTAAFQAIREVREQGATVIHLVSDSRYLVNGLTSWMAGWKTGGWAEPRENQDSWRALDEITQGIELTAEWARGHDVHPENEQVDQMVKDIIERWRGRQ